MKSSQKVLVLSKKAVSLLKRKDRDPFVDAGGRVNHKIKLPCPPVSCGFAEGCKGDIFYIFWQKVGGC